MRTGHAAVIAVLSVFTVAVFCYALIGRQEQKLLQSRFEVLNGRIEGFMMALRDFDTLSRACADDVHKVEARIACVERSLRESRPLESRNIDLGSIAISK